MSDFSVQNINNQQSLAAAELVQNGLKLIQGQVTLPDAATAVPFSLAVVDRNTLAAVEMPAGAIPVLVQLRSAITTTSGGTPDVNIGAALTAGGAIVANNGLITQLTDIAGTPLVAGSQSNNVTPLGAAFVPDFGTNRYVTVTVSGDTLTSATQVVNVNILYIDLQN